MNYGRISLYFQKVKSKSLTEVGDIIGGKVKENIDAGYFKHPCALKLSYALINAGYTINKSDGAVSSGADGKWYLYRVPDIAKFIRRIAKEELKAYNLSEFKAMSKQGIIVFDNCTFSDASGHVDLFNGVEVEGHGYFTRCGNISLYIL